MVDWCAACVDSIRASSSAQWFDQRATSDARKCSFVRGFAGALPLQSLSKSVAPILPLTCLVYLQSDDQNQAVNLSSAQPAQANAPTQDGSGASNPAHPASLRPSPAASTDVCITPCHSQAAPATPNPPFPPFSFATSVDPPKADGCGAAIGIPIPLQAVRRTSHSGSTLPPMPSEAVRAAPPPDAANVATAVPSSPASPAHLNTPPRLQYRRVFVPSTVMYNGVAQQMLIPMMCMVQAGSVAAGSPLRGKALAPPTLQRNAPNCTAPAVLATPLQHNAPRGGRCGKRKAQSPVASKSLGPAYVPLKSSSQQSRYGTRSNKLGGAGSKASTPDTEELGSREVMRGEMDALDMLADAALLELC